MSIAVTIVLVYFAVMLGIGYWAKSRVKSSKDFLVAGQTLGFMVMAVGTFASIQSGFGMIGHTANTYAWGLQSLIAAALFVPLAFALSWFLLGSRLYRLARQHDVYSVPDVIRLRYPGRAAHLAMSIAMFAGSVAYMTAQVTAMGVLVSLIFGTSIVIGAIIGSAIVALYTVVGGMLAGAWTDFIQGLLMVAMSIGIFILAINTLGGWGATLDIIVSHDSAFLQLEAHQPMTWIFTFALLAVLGAVAQPQLVTKFLMLRSPGELKWGACVASVAYATTTLFALGIGLTMRGLTIEGLAPELSNIDMTTTWFLNNMVPPAFAGFVLAGLLAAIMSSANSFIAVGASALTRDLSRALGFTLVNELLWARSASTAVVICALVFALYLSQVVFILGAIGWAAFAAAIFGPLVIGLYWRRATAMATTVAVVFGLVANMILTILTAEGVVSLPSYIQGGGVVVCLGIVIFLLLAVIIPSPGSARRFDELGISTRSRHGAVPVRIDVLIGVCFAGVTGALLGMFFDWWLLVYYALPLLATVFMLIGALNRNDQWSPMAIAQIAGFAVALLGLFICAHAVLDSTSLAGGLPLATAIIFYAIWPLTTLAAPLVFASIYAAWLRHDLLDVTARHHAWQERTSS